MPETLAFEGSIKRIQVLDNEGNADPSLDPHLAHDFLVKLYKTMVLCRTFDRKAVALQRQGRSFTYTPFEGQEAIQIVSAMLLEPNDWTFPSYRESAVYITRGVDMANLFIYLKGHEDGMATPGATKDMPLAIPVGSQTAHAPGAAYALKLKGTKNISVAYFGDGAASQGDFHEALNFASIYKLPVIFICSNNQWAISTPCKIQSGGKTIAQRALAYDIAGIQVDGLDPLAFYSVMLQAVERARAGDGPTLIEAVTYRFGPHSTADDPKKYRTEEEVAEWRKIDWPVRFTKYLQKMHVWDEKFEEQCQSEAAAAVEAAVAKAEQFTDSPTQMFDYVYSRMPASLQKQKAEFEAELAERKGGANA